MFAQLLKFEVSLHTRQIGFWVSFVTVVAAAILLTSLDFLGSSGGERIKSNGANSLAGITSAFYLGAIFFGAVFTITGTLRDDLHKSLELIHVTPISTHQMIWSRFLGVFIATSLILLAASLGMMLARYMPWADAEAFQSFNLWHYTYPFIFFSLVNALIVTAFYTVIAGISRSRAMVYVSAVVLLMLTQLGSVMSVQMEGDWLPAMINPFGDIAQYKITEYWPPAEQNSNVVPLWGLFGLNRLAWGALAIGALVASRLLFTRGIKSGKFKGNLEELPDTSIGSLTFTKAKTVDTFRLRIGQFFIRTRHESLTTLRSAPFLILACVGLIFFGLSAVFQNMFNPQPVIPISSQVAKYVMGGFSLFIYLIMIFFAGEIVWRDRVQGMTEVLDATPARNGVIMASKWASMCVVIAAALLFASVSGMVIQLVLGKAAVQPLVYFKTIFIAVGTPLFLLAGLVLMIQSLAPGRVVGMFISALALIGLLAFVKHLPLFTPPDALWISEHKRIF